MKSRKLPLIELLLKKYDEYSEKELYARIVCGEVKVADETVRDPRRRLSGDVELTLKSRKWVSRGGEKLDHALGVWGLDVGGKIVLDAGASTGGFTDCLLGRGAERVYSVDVGYNQLDYGLRTDSRVTVMERTNIMSLDKLQPAPDFAVADLSFRSITGAARHILGLTSENLLIALVKPQFEIPPSDDFDGVIRDDRIIREVLAATADSLINEGVEIENAIDSPIRGRKGNKEYLFMLRAGFQDSKSDFDTILNRLFS